LWQEQWFTAGCFSQWRVAFAVFVVKVTEISQVVMETVHHLDDGCQDSDHRAGHVISVSPQVDFVGLPEVFSRPEL